MCLFSDRKIDLIPCIIAKGASISDRLAVAYTDTIGNYLERYVTPIENDTPAAGVDQENLVGLEHNLCIKFHVLVSSSMYVYKITIKIIQPYTESIFLFYQM